jgi:hypothetical protein
LVEWVPEDSLLALQVLWIVLSSGSEFRNGDQRLKLMGFSAAVAEHCWKLKLQSFPFPMMFMLNTFMMREFERTF